jgi:hypothetical protein
MDDDGKVGIPHRAAPTPVFITLDAFVWPLGDATPGLIQIAAHELMHTWQFRYPLGTKDFRKRV